MRQRSERVHLEAGFTVLEAMVALAILAISLALLYEATTKALRLNNTSNALSYAAMLGETKLAALRKEWPNPASLEGQDNQIAWRIQLEDVDSQGYVRHATFEARDTNGQRLFLLGTAFFSGE